VAQKWLRQIADPIWAVKGLFDFVRYFQDWRQYSRMPYAEPISLADTYPQVHDRTTATRFAVHYFYVDGWAMRRITSTSPSFDVDVGSSIMFVTNRYKIV